MSQSGWVHLDKCDILQVTAKAILIRHSDEEMCNDHWLPKSQVSDPDQHTPGDRDVTVSITEYIAREKGLPGES